MNNQVELPPEPHQHIDRLLEELMSRAGEVLQARDGLRKLLAANRSIFAELSLPGVLRQVVESARELIGARYGALGVIGPDGSLESFVHSGMTPEQAERIGDLPRGRGLLGEVIVHPEPIRLHDISTDARSVGFPANHPPMHSFLGVPIRLRDEVYGNLYLTESLSGEFTQEHTELAIALAGTAAIAIENARLFREAQRRQEWLHASTEVTRLLLAGDGQLPEVAQAALTTADADMVAVLLPGPDDSLVVEVAVGCGAEELVGLLHTDPGSIAALVLSTGVPIRLAGVGDPDAPTVILSRVADVGPVMALPLTGPAGTRGVLLAGRLTGRSAFTLAELDMAAGFAGHATVALEMADSRSIKDRVSLLEERDRIARDLHDHVIQRLFATGLTVQSVSSQVPPAQAERLSAQVDAIDETIRQIRTAIFSLTTVSPGTGRSVRTGLLQTIDEVSRLLAEPPAVRLHGPIDAGIDTALAEDLDAVLREALTNVARHARATTVQVDILVSGGRVVLTVVDDGVGLPDGGRRSGLKNMRERAENRGGHLEVETAPGAGTTLLWSVPV